jgi:CBS domain containing-hemolysin-like protein
VRRLDRIELGALVALAGLSVVVLAALLTKGRALTGADGLLASDQLQYFTWIRQASEHGLIGNEYDLAPDHRVFLHPGFLISGVLHALLGITVPLSYLLWKPVAVAVTFAGALLYVRRLLPPGGQGRVELIPVLFSVVP